jgi:hypothetical protein
MRAIRIHITLPRDVLDRLKLIRQPGESYSDVIVRIAQYDGKNIRDDRARYPDAQQAWSANSTLLNGLVNGWSIVGPLRWPFFRHVQAASEYQC